jgi:poly(3-hydroxybutyrate) depolymerase
MTDTLKRFIASLFVVVFAGGCSTNVERGEATPDQPVSVSETALSRKSELKLLNSQGTHLEYFVREPRKGKRPLPAVFILAGVETGRDSLDLIDDRDDLLLLSMNYPHGEAMALTGFGLLKAPFALRRMASETLEGGVLAIDYLSKRPDVDQERIILLGVSVGSVLITSLAAEDRRADAVVLIYGGTWVTWPRTFGRTMRVPGGSPSGGRAFLGSSAPRSWKGRAEILLWSAPPG